MLYESFYFVSLWYHNLKTQRMKKRTFYTSIITLLVSGLYLIGFGVYGLSKLNYNNDMYVIILLGMLVLVFGFVSYIENRRRVF